MSCTLYARRVPKSEWPHYFKLDVRDKLYEKFGDLITPSDLPYLEGMLAMSNQQHHAQLQNIILILEEGDDVELRMEC